MKSRSHESLHDGMAASRRLKHGMRRITRWIPVRWRGAVLLAATIVLFPVIITAMILEAVTPRASADVTFTEEDSQPNPHS